MRRRALNVARLGAAAAVNSRTADVVSPVVDVVIAPPCAQPGAAASSMPIPAFSGRQSAPSSHGLHPAQPENVPPAGYVSRRAMRRGWTDASLALSGRVSR